MIRRLFVEKREAFREPTDHLLRQISEDLQTDELSGLSVFQRYDVEGLPDDLWEIAIQQVFSDPATELIYTDVLESSNADWQFGIEFLPGQFDQRADSARQCLQIIADCQPVVQCARIFRFSGNLNDSTKDRIKAYLINPVDSREAGLSKPDTLQPHFDSPESVAELGGFLDLGDSDLEQMVSELGLAMSSEDLKFCQTHFRDEAGRNPTITEIKLLDTYWSDHCRHTTFLTEIDSVEFQNGPVSKVVSQVWQEYLSTREIVYGESISQRPVCLMDIALMGMKSLRKEGKLPQLEISEEINAASIVVPIEFEDGSSEEWLIMFKNETHNHPTEIEPFGGAATCLGGAIRDPLSGRSYVYQAMRITGASDPTVAVEDTLEGKLPQRKICVEAAHGYSSYGNQIGLATGLVHEFYHPKFVAKRMEIGAVIAAAPRSQVVRGTPEPGDVILLIGGKTGRDGIGGATGSSKEHTESALENSAEVQKGDPPTERKLQRLFRNHAVSLMIKRCNDFGAGGVSVAIGELADSLDIQLDKVPLKYAGLDGTEIAISESQERMAVVISSDDTDTFLDAVAKENLIGVEVAQVTDTGSLRMRWKDKTIVDLKRSFLDTNGVRQHAAVKVLEPNSLPSSKAGADEGISNVFNSILSDINNCSQRGLVERFDSTIGAVNILHPFGGGERSTPPEAMASVIPTLHKRSETASVMSYGYDPFLSDWSPFHGAVFAVIESVSRVIASGGSLSGCHLTFQEYFEKLKGKPERWGKPFSALLGAYLAQRRLGIAAIGGKDSMSGSFKDLDVPPTLVSFAVSTAPAANVISPEFKGSDHKVVYVPVPVIENQLPDWDLLMNVFCSVESAILDKKVLSASVVSKGGIVTSLSKMCFGNRKGFVFSQKQNIQSLADHGMGGFLLELAPEADPALFKGVLLGRTSRETHIVLNNEILDIDELRRVWEGGLESVFPTSYDSEGDVPDEHLFLPHEPAAPAVLSKRPKVIIPVFPGTNCEYDSSLAFETEGAEVETLVFKNLSHADVEQSLGYLSKAIDESQILMLPGGFSAGDEPDGSGKFIASVFRNARVADSLSRLLEDRKGLVLGICNGFQALVKLGLLPYGRIVPPSEENPSLTNNRINRHVSCYVRTKVVSKLSPWLEDCPLGAEYLIPVSHGEGRFSASRTELAKMINHDQVATQYVNCHGQPTTSLPENPNGSVQGIEGITSPCGRVFGKMGHSERVGKYTGKNVPGDKVQPIFRSGVKYFTGW